MKEITVKAYAKINLSLDVLGMLPNGYHQVEMIMQQIELHDVVRVSWEAREKDGEIVVSTTRKDLPVDSKNLAYKAAELMMNRRGKVGNVYIHIEKNIPVAAGLAGGSGNGAAVLHGLNCLWEEGLSLRELCDMGVVLGADVPFCIMGQAKGNAALQLGDDEIACTCALAEGIGEKLTPIAPLNCTVLLSKPPVSVSTAQVYSGIDQILQFEKPDNDKVCKFSHHIDTNEIVLGLNEKNVSKITANMLNMLELFTSKRYPIVMYTKDMIEKQGRTVKALMSGSGPTVFAIYLNEQDAKADYELLCSLNEETYLTKTLV